jgi:hypothetical protein
MEGLTDSLREVSQLLVAEECLEKTLARIADLARRTISGCEMAGVTVLADGKPRTAVFTEDDATAIDGAQYLEDAGPCLAAYREQAVIGVCDTQVDPAVAGVQPGGGQAGRPEFAVAAVGRGGRRLRRIEHVLAAPPRLH